MNSSTVCERDADENRVNKVDRGMILLGRRILGE